MSVLGESLEGSTGWSTMAPYLHTIDYTMRHLFNQMDKQTGGWSYITYILLNTEWWTEAAVVYRIRTLYFPKSLKFESHKGHW